MEHSQKIRTLLNDLIEVNGQRILNYHAVLEGPIDHSDTALDVFEEMIVQGQQLQNELEIEFVSLTHELPERGNPDGPILKVWNTMKSFANRRSIAIGEVFDRGERALLQAYRYAEKQLDGQKSTKALIARQKAELKAFYRLYRQLYQSQPA